MKSDARASKHSSKRERASTRTRRSDSEASPFVNLLIASLKGGGCTILSMLVLSLIMSAVALLFSDHTPLIFPLALFTLYSCSFLSGVITKKSAGDGGVPLYSGVLSGAFLLVILSFISVLLKDVNVEDGSDKMPFILSLVLRALVILFSILGAYAADKAKQGAQRTKRARRR